MGLLHSGGIWSVMSHSDVNFHEKTVGVVKNIHSLILKLQNLNKVQSSNGGLSLVVYVTTSNLISRRFDAPVLPHKEFKVVFLKRISVDI